MLIAFTSYLHSPCLSPGAPGHVPFPDWLEGRPELHRCVGCMLPFKCAPAHGATLLP